MAVNESARLYWSIAIWLLNVWQRRLSYYALGVPHFKGHLADYESACKSSSRSSLFDCARLCYGMSLPL